MMKLPPKFVPLSSFKEFKELNTVHLLKIDTEGYELKVLKGINEEDLKI